MVTLKNLIRKTNPRRNIMKKIMIPFAAFCFLATLGCGKDSAQNYNEKLPPVDANTPRIKPAGSEKGGNDSNEARPKVIQ
jgi:hypothetical protein